MLLHRPRKHNVSVQELKALRWHVVMLFCAMRIQQRVGQVYTACVPLEYQSYHDADQSMVPC